jgi:putative effector of murein hydrolase LrgA (UPF0299 family)
VQIPYELMTPDQREARAEELEREVSREWLRFAIAEFILLWVPFGVFLLVYVTTDTISDSALVPVVIAGGTWCTIIVLYWVYRRIMPLQKQLQALRAEE